MAENAVYLRDAVDNVRLGYHGLSERVRAALQTQVGQTASLTLIRDEALRFIATSDLVRSFLFYQTLLVPHTCATVCPQHRASFTAEEYARLETNVAEMVTLLDDACHRSSDPPPSHPLVVYSISSHGYAGRPRMDIDETFLAQALQLRSITDIARELHCAPRTVRRRAIEAGLRTPGDAVYQDVEADNGTVVRQYTSTTRPVSNLFDDELDTHVHGILESFPRMGRAMIRGVLSAAGHNVPMTRVVASYIRVHGPPPVFGGRAIHRRVYSVAGANALWHHDGQHGQYCLAFWSELVILTALIILRSHQVQNCHSLLCGRTFAPCHRDRCPRQ